MKLLKAKFSAFKSIVECQLQIDPKITVLVGPNEGGKTNILKALEAFNADRDFSPSLVCQSSPAFSDGYFPEIQLQFGNFSPSERNQIVEAWRASFEGIPTTTQDKKSSNEADKPAETEALDREFNTIAAAQMTPSPPLAGFQRLTATKQGNSISEYFFHFDDIDLVIPEKGSEERFKNALLGLLPHILYFDDINLLRGEVKIKDLVGADPAFETERNLLALGGIVSPDVLRGDVHRRDVAIHSAQNRLTDRLHKYWTQDPSRKFHIDIDGDTLRVRISDDAGVFDYPESRSLGGRWFISFYINFASRIGTFPGNPILVFDEPGIHVHPRGQRDLLPMFEELAKQYQIIYSTHLPFLINRNFPGRIRVVEKKGNQGTIINNKPHQKRWEAIRSAIGLLAADSFIIGDTCLIVEGVSDHIYIAGLSDFLAEIEAPCLDMNRVSVIPGGSATETIPLARFCQAEKIPVIVLLDSDNQGNQAAKMLIADDFLESRQIVRTNDGLSSPGDRCSTLEDLLPPEMLLSGVNAFYQSRVNVYAPMSIEEVETARKENSTLLPTVNGFAKIFNEKGYGSFDKRSVAEQFINSLPSTSGLGKGECDRLKSQFENVGRLVKVLIEKFEKLSGVTV